MIELDFTGFVVVRGDAGAEVRCPCGSGFQWEGSDDKPNLLDWLCWHRNHFKKRRVTPGMEAMLDVLRVDRNGQAVAVLEDGFRAALLDDIRQIVREELRVDRFGPGEG